MEFRVLGFGGLGCGVQGLGIRLQGFGMQVPEGWCMKSVWDKGLWGCNLFEREGDVPRDHVFRDSRRLPPQRDPPVVQV